MFYELAVDTSGPEEHAAIARLIAEAHRAGPRATELPGLMGANAARLLRLETR